MLPKANTVSARNAWTTRLGQRSDRDGLTLVELLVVIAIIGVLAGLLLPAVQYARNSSRRTQCLSQMRQIAVAMDSYMDSRGSRAVYPSAARLPSVNTTMPSLVKVLGSYMETNNLVYRCPSDIFYTYNDPSGNIVTDYNATFFDKEGLSYEYNADPPGGLAAKTRPQVFGSKDKMSNIKNSATVVLANDFEAFHGTEGDVGARNFVFLDGHADSP
jgi:prepilin-type N-terminal cleavage/methylation domain-containing protein